MERKNTHERLKEIMAINGYKQVDILNKCKPYCEKYNVKLGRNDLSQYVSGKVIPSQKKLTILALALNVNEAWLMGYNVTMERKEIEISTNEFETIAKEWIKSSDKSPEEKQKFLRELAVLIDKENE